MSKQAAVFLTAESPVPAFGGSKIRDLHMIRFLAEFYDLEVLCFRPAEAPVSEAISSAAPGVRMIEVERQPPSIWKRSLQPLRPEVMHGYCDRMAKALETRAEPGKLLWVSRLGMASYIPLCRKLGYHVVLDQHHVESHLLISDALSSLRQLPSLLLAAQCSYYESLFCRESHLVVATSDLDASKLSKLAPSAPIFVIPNPIDSEAYANIRGSVGSTIFFSGTLNNGPNVEGIRWFITEILPRLKRSMGSRVPRIVVAGANPSSELERELADAGIELRSNPDSMLPSLAEAAVVIVPLRSGGGTRFKILEAMAAGRAVVSTGKGAEGLVLSPTYDIWIADAPDRFTSAVLHLLENQELRTALGQRAAQTIRDRYDWRRAREALAQIIKKLPAWNKI